MPDPFTKSKIDGTQEYAVPLKVVDQLYLKAMPPVIALRLESLPSETSGEKTAEQWGLTRDQARFLMESLRDCLQAEEPEDKARQQE